MSNTNIIDKTPFLSEKFFGTPLDSEVFSLPGATAQSSAALIKILKRNFLQNHGYFGSENAPGVRLHKCVS